MDLVHSLSDTIGGPRVDVVHPVGFHLVLQLAPRPPLACLMTDAITFDQAPGAKSVISHQPSSLKAET